MQIASRILLVWVIADQFPFTVSTSPAYSTMLLAWSITEVVRYTYFVFFLTGRVPDILQWLRWVNKSEGRYQDSYSLAADTTRSTSCIHSVLEVRRGWSTSLLHRLEEGIHSTNIFYAQFWPFMSLVWIFAPCTVNESKLPSHIWRHWLFWADNFKGSYILYTHMMAQRRRALRGKQRAKNWCHRRNTVSLPDWGGVTSSTIHNTKWVGRA
jgi:Protein tyrosine phosphatase-like protein, PTPLA